MYCYHCHRRNRRKSASNRTGRTAGQPVFQTNNSAKAPMDNRATCSLTNPANNILLILTMYNIVLSRYEVNSKAYALTHLS